MFNGYMYNLTNPLYGEDVGMAVINRMYPTNIDPLTGMPQTYLPGVMINPGQPLMDSYETPKQKRETNIIKTIAGGLIIAGLAFLGVKKGVSLARSAMSNITSPFKNAWQWIKGLFK